MHYSLMGKIILPFLDSDLLYTIALSGRLDCNLKKSLKLLSLSPLKANRVRIENTCITKPKMSDDNTLEPYKAILCCVYLFYKDRI